MTYFKAEWRVTQAGPEARKAATLALSMETAELLAGSDGLGRFACYDIEHFSERCSILHSHPESDGPAIIKLDSGAWPFRIKFEGKAVDNLPLGTTPCAVNTTSGFVFLRHL